MHTSSCQCTLRDVTALCPPPTPPYVTHRHTPSPLRVRRHLWTSHWQFSPDSACIEIRKQRTLTHHERLPSSLPSCRAHTATADTQHVAIPEAFLSTVHLSCGVAPPSRGYLMPVCDSSHWLPRTLSIIIIILACACPSH